MHKDFATLLINIIANTLPPMGKSTDFLGRTSGKNLDPNKKADQNKQVSIQQGAIRDTTSLAYSFRKQA